MMTTDRTPHILVVDDHRDIRDLVAKYLTKNGYRVSVADGGAMMKKVLATSGIDLVVLDLMMPGEDGLTLCRDLRAAGDMPIIMLTAMAEETDRVVGLEIGADDYLTKPFNPRELLARIKAVLRRTASLPPKHERLENRRLAFDRWIFDGGQRELIGEDGVAVALSTADFHLLSAFIKHPKMVLSRDQLLDLTQGRMATAFDRSIDNQVSRLRRKIEIDPKKPELIKDGLGRRLQLHRRGEADLMRRLKRLWPTSLTGQMIALLLLALVFAQILTLMIFADERRFAIQAADRSQLLGRTASVVRLLENSPPSTPSDRSSRTASERRLRYWLSPTSPIDGDDDDKRHDIALRQRIAELLGDSAEREIRVAIADDDHWSSWWRRRGDDDNDDGRRRHRRHRAPNVLVSMKLTDGAWLNLESRLLPPSIGWKLPALTWLGLMGIALSTVVIVMIRRITRPMAALAAAAETGRAGGSDRSPAGGRPCRRSPDHQRLQSHA